MFGSWEHESNRRSFKDILDAGTVFGATQYDPAESVRTLQILIGRMLSIRLRKTKIQAVGNVGGENHVEPRLRRPLCPGMKVQWDIPRISGVPHQQCRLLAHHPTHGSGSPGTARCA